VNPSGIGFITLSALAEVLQRARKQLLRSLYAYTMPYRVPHPSTEDEYPLTERAMGRGKGVRESFYYNDYKARAT